MSRSERITDNESRTPRKLNGQTNPNFRKLNAPTALGLVLPQSGHGWRKGAAGPLPSCLGMIFCRPCRGFALRGPRTHGWRRGLRLYRPVWSLMMMRSSAPERVRVAVAHPVRATP